MIFLNCCCNLCNFRLMCTNNCCQSLNLLLCTFWSLLFVTSVTLSHLKPVSSLIQFMLWAIKLRLDIIQLTNFFLQIMVQSLYLLSKDSNLILIIWQLSLILLHLSLYLLFIGWILMNSGLCLLTVLWNALDDFIESLNLLWHDHHPICVFWYSSVWLAQFQSWFISVLFQLL